jgi:hypothetical protein
VRKSGRGGAPKGPATYPLRIHQARVSVNSSPYSETDELFGILVAGRTEEKGTAEPAFRSCATLSARIIWSRERLVLCSFIKAESLGTFMIEDGLEGSLCDGKDFQKEGGGGR